MVCTSSELPPNRKGVFYWSLKKSFQYEKVNFARAMQVLGDDDKWSERKILALTFVFTTYDTTFNVIF